MSKVPFFVSQKAQSGNICFFSKEIETPPEKIYIEALSHLLIETFFFEQKAEKPDALQSLHTCALQTALTLCSKIRFSECHVPLAPFCCEIRRLRRCVMSAATAGTCAVLSKIFENLGPFLGLLKSAVVKGGPLAYRASSLEMKLESLFWKDTEKRQEKIQTISAGGRGTHAPGLRAGPPINQSINQSLRVSALFFWIFLSVFFFKGLFFNSSLFEIPFCIRSI